jgi:pentatricopeptide repeat protein
VISWTALMSGYVQCLDFNMVLKVFQSFRRTQIPLDKHCVSTTPNACTGLKYLKKGRQLHSLVFKLGLLSSDFVLSSFINTYAKCGQTADFIKLYSQSKITRSLVLINDVLSGFCLNFCPKKCSQALSGREPVGFLMNSHILLF